MEILFCIHRFCNIPNDFCCTEAHMVRESSSQQLSHKTQLELLALVLEDWSLMDLVLDCMEFQHRRTCQCLLESFQNLLSTKERVCVWHRKRAMCGPRYDPSSWQIHVAVDESSSRRWIRESCVLWLRNARRLWGGDDHHTGTAVSMNQPHEH